MLFKKYILLESDLREEAEIDFPKLSNGNKDWKTIFSVPHPIKNLADAKNITEISKYPYLTTQKLWDMCLLEFESLLRTDSKTITKFGEAFRLEVFEYGIELSQNPFLFFLKNKNLINTNIYKIWPAIHNGFIRNKITDIDLRKDTLLNKFLCLEALWNLDNSLVLEYISIFNDLKDKDYKKFKSKWSKLESLESCIANVFTLELDNDDPDPFIKKISDIGIKKDILTNILEVKKNYELCIGDEESSNIILTIIKYLKKTIFKDKSETEIKDILKKYFAVLARDTIILSEADIRIISLLTKSAAFMKKIKNIDASKAIDALNTI